MNKLANQLQGIIENGTQEDIDILQGFINNMEKKQKGEFSTYLSAGLNMEREITEDTCSVTIPNTPFVHNTIDIPHGGILAVILDTAMGTLANSKCPPGYGAVTTNLTIHYLSVTREETITAKSHIIRNGKHSIVVEGNIYQQNGKHVATATGSFFIVPK